MADIIGVLTEAALLAVGFLIFLRANSLCTDTVRVRVFLALFKGASIILFVIGTLVFELRETVSALLFSTLPSLIVFFLVSRNKDFRFLVTYSSVAIVQFVLCFLARSVNFAFGDMAGIGAGFAVVLILLVVYLRFGDLLRKYRDLLDESRHGWSTVATSSLLLFLCLVFMTSYPEPIRKRPEYYPVIIAMFLVTGALYAALITLLVQRKRLSDMNDMLSDGKKWHMIAYIDVLTGMKNRTAYMERVNAVERESAVDRAAFAIMLDINGFKAINDTYGHKVGDITLQDAAEELARIFSDERFEIFRIGGDEFAVICLDISEGELHEELEEIGKVVLHEELGCRFAYGVSEVRFAEFNAVENAFERADKEMYECKLRNKGSES